MCAWAFGDSYDCYAAVADAVPTYWDSGTGGGALVAGRFSGSMCYSSSANTGVFLAKSSAVNDAVHHLVVAFRSTAAISGTTLGAYLQLLDGTTGQCCIVFRSDGAILLTSGTPAGAVLDTYTGAFTVQNTWYAFEFEVVINNSTGSWAVRKNGNPGNDRALGGLDTQVSANAYANKLQFGQQGAVNAHQTDDLYWRSDASSVAWMGDIRCYTRAPASDAAVQFSRAPLTLQQAVTVSGTTYAKTANTVVYTAFTPTWSGTITAVDIGCSAATAHMKAAIYGSALTTVLGTSSEVTNPVAYPTLNTLTFSPSVAVTAGTTYYLAVNQDASITYRVLGITASTGTTTYASFPAASPTGLTSGQPPPHATIYINPTSNYPFVSEPQQDATTSYVYDSVVGHSDLYGIAAIASTPLTTFAVVTRAYAIKSDAGTRTMAVQLKSGASTVASPTVVLTPSNWQWAWRHDTTDPQTGSAWTAAAVNTALIGPTVIA